MRAILGGRHFTPEAHGSFWFHKSGSSYGLDKHIFYRQASLFVAYLKNRSEVQFGLFMLAIEDGGNFDKSFHSKYGTSIDETWQDFVTQLRNKQIEMHLAYKQQRLLLSYPFPFYATFQEKLYAHLWLFRHDDLFLVHPTVIID